MSYLSDTSSEMGDWPSVGDEQDYPRDTFVSFTHPVDVLIMTTPFPPPPPDIASYNGRSIQIQDG